ncbi:inorganic diphosphatase [Henriciella barbarensis]|jgi:inorganic pyrophosphatase|uniref:Inorganic pyrophosphatase n=3 Tax=Henriciella TaxID=453849 RepID=A0A399RNY5_9PROT|nr:MULTISPECIES: inorganic diphosphatase [Henriciella]MCH2457559.1 inorganic diphosphatase [Henriciella sp.]MCZ4297161.1 inorganic diphosphatase [Henriciella marina]RIJ23948.1 inorganic diphosphatase [Henriciella barbarensis]RIJ31974.1 inorganic diphosphatase [Henriciella algicola]
MDISKISIGENAPDDLNVIIEVPLGGEPIKYEIDKASGAMFVDRYLYTSMRYPCNYGFVPHTLSLDGDPIDVMVVGQRALVPGAVVRARPIGVLLMEDDGGEDEKILAVPHQKLTRFYEKVQNYTDLPDTLIDRIQHFFEHYKDLEPNKWVKVRGWEGVDKARELIRESIERGAKS